MEVGVLVGTREESRTSDRGGINNGRQRSRRRRRHSSHTATQRDRLAFDARTKKKTSIFPWQQGTRNDRAPAVNAVPEAISHSMRLPGRKEPWPSARKKRKADVTSSNRSTFGQCDSRAPVPHELASSFSALCRHLISRAPHKTCIF